METLHPGLYFQEIAGTKPVEGASVATAGFVGIAPKGQVGKAVLVTSWSEYVREFGDFINNSYLGYAVRGFFENGGTRAYIVRAVEYTLADGVATKASAVATKQHPDLTPALTINAKSDGLWGNDIQFEIVEGSDASVITFNVYYKDELVEVYKDVDMETIEAETLSSSYIEVISLLDEVPAPVAKTTLAGGDDGIANISDDSYKHCLSAFDNLTVNLITVPGVTSQAVQSGLLDYAENRKDTFAILETPMGLSVTDAKEYVVKTAKLSSDYGAIYYPFVKVSDPIGLGKNPVKLIPPSGHVAGAIVRTDTTQGVWRAPAGIDVKLRGVIGLAHEASDSEQDILNPNAINCIRAFDGEGICIWGTRTLANKYISVRRLIMFVEQSLGESMLWTVFKPNDEKLFGMIKSAVEDFLANIWAQGGLKGSSAQEAFYVKCDSELNTEAVIDAGKTYVDVGLAVHKPSEFIIFRLSLIR